MKLPNKLIGKIFIGIAVSIVFALAAVGLATLLANIAPNHALVPPTETLFHRAQSAGQMLVLHGYFRAA